MTKSNGILLAIIGLLIIGGGWYLYRTPRAATPAVLTVTTAASSTTTQGSSTAPMTATVKMTKNGFSPDPITIKQGGTVTFVSVDRSPMWVASNAHPSHMQYDGTSRAQHCPNTTGTAFDQCVSGSTYSFKFLKIGQWNYHNHVNADDGGTIMVIQ